MKELTLKNKTGDFLLYTSPQGDIKVEVFFQDENIWLTQKKMAELFDVEINTINYHLKEIFKSRELDEAPTIRRFRIVQKEAEEKAFREYEIFNKNQPINSDFDKMTRRLLCQGKNKK